MRQRRRAERGHYTTRSSQDLTVPRRIDGQRVQRMLKFGVAALLLVLIGLVGYALFDSFYQTPRRVIAEIGNETVTLRDVLPQTRLDATARGQINITGSVNDYARNLVFRQRASALGLAVSPEDIDARIIRRFELADEQGQFPEELTDDGRSAYESFQDTVNVSQQDYRDWTEGQLIQGEIQRYFEAQETSDVEQVFVNWIATQSVVDVEAALERINAGEPFGSVAAEVSEELLISDPQGVVGWVPEDAFDELDAVLFDPSLERDEVIGPITTSFGSMLLQVTDGPSEQPLSEAMRILVGANRFQQWMDAQSAELISTLFITAEDAQWIVDHL
ncbi:MAG: peptidylprolyl isomerase [Dehalococcoidia bacterium]